MSHSPFVSPETRSVAGEKKTTTRPSAEMTPPPLKPLLAMPFWRRLAIRVVRFFRSRTKTSRWPLVSLGTRFEAPRIENDEAAIRR